MTWKLAPPKRRISPRTSRVGRVTNFPAASLESSWCDKGSRGLTSAAATRVPNSSALAAKSSIRGRTLERARPRRSEAFLGSRAIEVSRQNIPSVYGRSWIPRPVGRAIFAFRSIEWAAVHTNVEVIAVRVLLIRSHHHRGGSPQDRLRSLHRTAMVEQ